MTTTRVGCTRCGTQILPTTAEKNGGMCRPCKLGNKPIAPKTAVGKIARSYSVIRELTTGIALTIGCGGLAAFFTYNVFTGVSGNDWFFRYVYSPVFVVLCLLFVVAGVAFVISASKKMKQKT